MRLLKSVVAVFIAAVLCFGAGCCRLTRQGDSLVVTLVTDTSGVGDKGFNEVCWNGLMRAREELGIVVKKIESSDPANYVKNLSTAARYSDLTVANGFLLKDAMAKVSALYPESRFVFIDGVIPDQDNVASYTFRSQEVGFLVGILAAGMSTNHKVGVLRGEDIPPVEVFDVGFRAGVICANETWNLPTEVKSLTVGSFNNANRGNSMTSQLINDGCDVIFQLAGATGLGAIDAVREADEGVYLIGVDLDQDDEAPGRILTSAMKRIDNVVYQAVKNLQEGEFQGGHYSMGTTEKALSLTNMRNTREKIPARVLGAIEAAERMIITGSIELPASYKELEGFTPIRLPGK